jgi:hypothetical protein
MIYNFNFFLILFDNEIKKYIDNEIKKYIDNELVVFSVNIEQKTT